MSTETQELTVVTLVELKQDLGAVTLRFVDSKKKAEDGTPLRGKVYLKTQEIGLMKKGLFEQDFLAAGEHQISAVFSEKLQKWVFTLGVGTEI